MAQRQCHGGFEVRETLPEAVSGIISSMRINYSAPLSKGSRIAVTAPSSGVEPPLHARLDLVIGHLKSQGFALEEGRCLREQRQSASASAGERAAELMQFLLRE